MKDSYALSEVYLIVVSQMVSTLHIVLSFGPYA